MQFNLNHFPAILCMCNWPQLSEVCTDCDLVMFQSQTVTPTPRVYNYRYNFKSIPPASPIYTVFPDRYFPSSILPPTPLQSSEY